MRLTISIVTFNNADVIEKALTSIHHSDLEKGSYRVIVVDNSSTDETVHIVTNKFPQVTLIRSENVGFGAGHNKAMTTARDISDYHLIMNPDIYFESSTLSDLLAFMDHHPEAGLVMPKILYPDHRIQYLCKELPTPFDLIGRRFIPGFLKPLFKKRLDHYEFRDRNYDEIMNVPHLSGCFMMVRSDVLRTVGLFDERFFMYLEDVDFSRRIHARYKTLYYPGTAVYHHYHKASYKQWKHLKYHIASAVKYFNKWGWFSFFICFFRILGYNYSWFTQYISS
ncbi:MAG: glycosyltransferase family 2 protein [Candidatus Omnitrophota bacterium]